MYWYGPNRFTSESLKGNPLAVINCTDIDESENFLPDKFTHRSQLLHAGPDWVVCVVEDKKTTFDMNPGFGLINVTNQEYSHVGTILARNKKGI